MVSKQLTFINELAGLEPSVSLWNHKKSARVEAGASRFRMRECVVFWRLAAGSAASPTTTKQPFPKAATRIGLLHLDVPLLPLRFGSGDISTLIFRVSK